MYFTQHCFICRPADFAVSEDAGVEPKTVCVEALGMSGYESVVEAVIVLEEAVRMLKEAARVLKEAVR